MRRMLSISVCVTFIVQRQRWPAKSTSSLDSATSGGEGMRRRSVIRFIAIQCASVFSRR